MYRLSAHAQRRIRQRRLRVEWLLAALEGKQRRQIDGTVMFCDPVTHVALVIDLQRMLIITAIRLRPAKYKRIYSGRRPSWQSNG